LEKGKAKDKGKGKGKEVDIVLVDESTDEDEPVFVGVASKLAKKYNFKSASSISSTSTGIVVVPDAQEIDKPKPPPLVLHPPLSPQGKAPSIPAWLGKSSILLQIPYCVVCKLRWKKENGAARWVSHHSSGNVSGSKLEAKVAATYLDMSTTSISTSSSSA
jgi:hypothetical protein